LRIDWRILSPSGSPRKLLGRPTRRKATFSERQRRYGYKPGVERPGSGTPGKRADFPAPRQAVPEGLAENVLSYLPPGWRQTALRFSSDRLAMSHYRTKKVRGWCGGT